MIEKLIEFLKEEFTDVDALMLLVAFVFAIDWLYS
jgi:hypothetical protein